MRRGVLLLNLLLVSAIGLSCWQMSRQYRATAERQRQFLSKRFAAPAPPILTLPAEAPLIHASNYLEIAARLPFSPDRNPTVVVEVAPPKPMPPLPAYHGMMNFGQGPLVILSTGKAPQKSYKVGDVIGEFKLVAVAQSGLVFEWDGKQVPAAYAELMRSAPEASGAPAQPPATSAPATAPAAAPSSSASVTSLGGGAAASSSASSASSSGPMGDVADFTGQRECKAGDNSPDGTVVNGYRKVSTRSPFGVICRWVPVK